MLAAIESALKEAKSNWDESRKKELETYEARYKELQEAKDKDAEAIKQLEKDLDELNIKFQEVVKAGKKELKSFQDVFAKSVDENTEFFKSIAKGTRGKVEKTINLLEGLERKDVDFDNFSAGLYDKLTTSRILPGVFQEPYAPVWLRNVLTNATTDSKIVEFVRENVDANLTAGEADIWDGDDDIADLLPKPDVSFNFEDATERVYWIAAITRIKRETFDDVPFLRSYIPQELVYGRRGLLARENALIINRLNANSTPYNNRKSILVEQIFDAVLGQIRTNGYNATTILMSHLDVVDMILNKATGSGEYDLPPGTVSFATGQLTIAGVPVIGLPQIDQGTWYVFDRTKTYFLNRMTPEVRFFEEDRDNVPKNLITVRAEERAGALVLSSAAVISNLPES